MLAVRPVAVDKHMLEIRPVCENCSRPLPPHSTEAMICSFESTFCAECAITLLHNVCPNCGGGFQPRPVRPSRNWKAGNYLGRYPAATAPELRPVDPRAHQAFAEPIISVPPDNR